MNKSTRYAFLTRVSPCQSLHLLEFLLGDQRIAASLIIDREAFIPLEEEWRAGLSCERLIEELDASESLATPEMLKEHGVT